MVGVDICRGRGHVNTEKEQESLVASYPDIASWKENDGRGSPAIPTLSRLVGLGSFGAHLIDLREDGEARTPHF